MSDTAILFRCTVNTLRHLSSSIARVPENCRYIRVHHQRKPLWGRQHGTWINKTALRKSAEDGALMDSGSRRVASRLRLSTKITHLVYCIKRYSAKRSFRFSVLYQSPTLFRQRLYLSTNLYPCIFFCIYHVCIPYPPLRNGFLYHKFY